MLSVSPAPSGSLAALNAAWDRQLERPRAKPQKIKAPRRIAPNSEHVRWAVEIRRALLQRAVELTKDDAQADDLVQELYLKWWERPPHAKTATELKHWMRTVLLNMVRKRWRAKELGTGEEFFTLPGERELQFAPVEDDY